MAIIKTKLSRGVEGSPTRINIVDTGTEGTKVALGTTGQRGSTTGQWRYNTTTGFFEGRNTGGDYSTLEPTPTVTSVDVTEICFKQYKHRDENEQKLRRRKRKNGDENMDTENNEQYENEM